MLRKTFLLRRKPLGDDVFRQRVNMYRAMDHPLTIAQEQTADRDVRVEDATMKEVRDEMKNQKIHVNTRDDIQEAQTSRELNGSESSGRETYGRETYGRETYGPESKIFLRESGRNGNGRHVVQKDVQGEQDGKAFTVNWTFVKRLLGVLFVLFYKDVWALWRKQKKSDLDPSVEDVDGFVRQWRHGEEAQFQTFFPLDYLLAELSAMNPAFAREVAAVNVDEVVACLHRGDDERAHELVDAMKRDHRLMAHVLTLEIGFQQGFAKNMDDVLASYLYLVDKCPESPALAWRFVALSTNSAGDMMMHATMQFLEAVNRSNARNRTRAEEVANAKALSGNKPPPLMFPEAPVTILFTRAFAASWLGSRAMVAGSRRHAADYLKLSIVSVLPLLTRRDGRPDSPYRLCALRTAQEGVAQLMENAARLGMMEAFEDDTSPQSPLAQLDWRLAGMYDLSRGLGLRGVMKGRKSLSAFEDEFNVNLQLLLLLQQINQSTGDIDMFHDREQLKMVLAAIMSPTIAFNALDATGALMDLRDEVNMNERLLQQNVLRPSMEMAARLHDLRVRSLKDEPVIDELLIKNMIMNELTARQTGAVKAVSQERLEKLSNLSLMVSEQGTENDHVSPDDRREFDAAIREHLRIQFSQAGSIDEFLKRTHDPVRRAMWLGAQYLGFAGHKEAKFWFERGLQELERQGRKGTGDWEVLDVFRETAELCAMSRNTLVPDEHVLRRQVHELRLTRVFVANGWSAQERIDALMHSKGGMPTPKEIVAMQQFDRALEFPEEDPTVGIAAVLVDAGLRRAADRGKSRKLQLQSLDRSCLDVAVMATQDVDMASCDRCLYRKWAPEWSWIHTSDMDFVQVRDPRVDANFFKSLVNALGREPRLKDEPQ